MKYFVFNTKCLMRCVDENGEEYYKESVGIGKEPYSEEKVEYIKSVAIDGKYTTEEVDDPEPDAPPTDAERITELEEALAMLLSGVTE